jgi:hypothetical protein
MISRRVAIYGAVVSFVSVLGCTDRSRSSADSARALPPVFPGAPAGNTGWDSEAGSVAVVPLDNSSDTVAVIIPEVTDSTLGIAESISAPVSGLTFDLFSRGNKVASGVRSIPLPPVDTSKQECFGWPLALLTEKQGNWSVGFTSGRAQLVPLDSIDALHGSDSVSLAAALVRAASTLRGVSDPTFRGLPFRVRSAFTFRVDSVDAVIADVVRSINEEANPQIEHVLLVGERPAGSTSTYNVRYSNRTAGKEESTAASEVVAVLAIGASKRPAIVINIEYSDGNRLGLLEKIGGEWRATWRSAFTDC